jgi:hypothetical protein
MFQVGLPLGPQAGFFFMVYIIFTFFCVTLGQSIAAFSPNIKVSCESDRLSVWST